MTDYLFWESYNDLKKSIKTGSDNEYRKVINKFLSKYQEGGLLEWRK